MVTYSLSQRAYGKITLHGAKYSQCAINGVLLGAYSKKDGKVCVSDAVPLFHQNLSLAPMLEIALAQVEIFGQSKGLSIVGYYHGYERASDIKLDDSAVGGITARCIATKINSTCEHCCVLMIDNTTILSSKGDIPFKMYTRAESSWKEQKDISIDGSVEKISKLLRNGSYLKIVDFDEHLDTVAADWTNVHINSLIEPGNNLMDR